MVKKKNLWIILKSITQKKRTHNMKKGTFSQKLPWALILLLFCSATAAAAFLDGDAADSTPPAARRTASGDASSFRSEQNYWHTPGRVSAMRRMRTMGIPGTAFTKKHASFSGKNSFKRSHTGVLCLRGRCAVVNSGREDTLFSSSRLNDIIYYICNFILYDVCQYKRTMFARQESRRHRCAVVS